MVFDCSINCYGDLLQELQALCERGTPHVLVDVRLPVEMDICQLPGSTSILLQGNHNVVKSS